MHEKKFWLTLKFEKSSTAALWLCQNIPGGDDISTETLKECSSPRIKPIEMMRLAEEKQNINRFGAWR